MANFGFAPTINDVYTLNVKKGLDDAMWSDANDLNEVGTVSMRAAETIEKNLSPKQSYELSIAVNACVNAICRNLSKAKVRLFSKDGKEIVGGPLFELLRRPAPGVSIRRFIWELASWWNIAGEFVVLKDVVGGDVKRLMALDPTRLGIQQPMNTPNKRSDVTQWKYDWHDGTTSLIRDDMLIFEAMFNPNHPVRGLSPLVTGSVEVGTGYSLSRYNKSFFDNSGVPSHLLILPDGTSNSQRKDIERRYKEEFGANRNNSHKVMVVAGKDAKIELLEQPFQDGSFMELRKSVLQQIAMLYRVPAIEAGIYDKTRFDTAAEERKLFVESTLMPQMDVLSEALQAQLVDQHFSLETGTPEKVKLTKAMGESFEVARANRSDSRVIVLLDPDTLPVMGSVKAAQISVAKDFRDTLMLSAKETADYFGLDIEDRKEREDVWIDRKYVNVTNPEINQKFMPQPKPAAGEKPAAEKKPAEKPAKKPDRKTTKDADKHIRELRRLTMKNIDGGVIWSLADADGVSDVPLCKRISRIIRHELKTIFPQGREAAKQYFNRLAGERFATTHDYN